MKILFLNTTNPWKDKRASPKKTEETTEKGRKKVKTTRKWRERKQPNKKNKFY